MRLGNLVTHLNRHANGGTRRGGTSRDLGFIKIEGNRYECKPCGKPYKTYGGARQHAKTHEEGDAERRKCQRCNKIFAHASGLRLHAESACQKELRRIREVRDQGGEQQPEGAHRQRQAIARQEIPANQQEQECDWIDWAGKWKGQAWKTGEPWKTLISIQVDGEMMRIKRTSTPFVGKQLEGGRVELDLKRDGKQIGQLRDPNTITWIRSDETSGDMLRSTAWART